MCVVVVCVVAVAARSDHHHPKKHHHPTPAGDAAAPGGGGGGYYSGPSAYAQWAVYKAKAALTVRIIKPSWSITPKGNWALER